MSLRRLKLSGLRCRCLVPEMMICGGLDQLLMKTDRFEELKRSLLVDGLSMVCNLCFAF